MHHGTYGANGLARVFDEFPIYKRANATAIFASADAGYWSIRNGCSNCANPLNTQLPNRGSLLWDNFDNRFSSGLLNLLPWEIPLDLPTATIYNDKITAYWGEISPSWRLTTVNLSTLNANISHAGEGVGDDLGLAAAGYLIEAADKGSFSNVPAPKNDGFVPVESARFDGADLMGRVHCAGHNHRNMKDGDLLTPCYPGGKTLFKSVRDLILGASVTSPRILVGPNRAGFGSQTYGFARPAGSLPTNTIEVELSNLGDEALQITSLSLTGENPDQFAIVNPMVPFSVAPTSSVRIRVAFNPTSPGPKSAELQAVNDSSNSVVTVHIDRHWAARRMRSELFTRESIYLDSRRHW